MPGKLEKLELTAERLLATGMIDSLEEFDQTANDLVANHYARRREIHEASLELEAAIREGLEQMKRGEVTRYKTPEDAARSIAERAKERRKQA